MTNLDSTIATEYVREVQRAIHANARVKGFWSRLQEAIDAGFADLVVPVKLMLNVTELAEAMEAVRHGEPLLDHEPDGKPVGLASELADDMIRLFDLAEYLGVDLWAVLIEKMDYNTGRPHLHGGKTV